MSKESSYSKDFTLLNYNGEPLDPVMDGYLLGKGYRAYLPSLMRFTAPDSLSPFGIGSINPYAYCEGDPINHTDPTGHFSLSGLFHFGERFITMGGILSFLPDKYNPLYWVGVGQSKFNNLISNTLHVNHTLGTVIGDAITFVAVAAITEGAGSSISAMTAASTAEEAVAGEAATAGSMELNEEVSMARPGLRGGSNEDAQFFRQARAERAAARYRDNNSPVELVESPAPRPPAPVQPAQEELEPGIRRAIEEAERDLRRTFNMHISSLRTSPYAPDYEIASQYTPSLPPPTSAPPGYQLNPPPMYPPGYQSPLRYRLGQIGNAIGNFLEQGLGGGSSNIYGGFVHIPPP